MRNHQTKNKAHKVKIVALGLRGIPNVQGGIETHCENLYPYLVQRGFDITILARRQSVGSRVYSFKGATVIPTWAPNFTGIEALVHSFLGVFTAFRLKADILHIHAIGPALVAPLARLLGLKVVVTHHGPDYERQKWGRVAKAILRIGEYLGVKFANELIVISDTIGRLVIEKYGRQNFHLIFNGVPTPPWDSAKNVTETLREFGIDGKPYILCVGRLVPEKRFQDVIEALGGRDDYRVVIVGSANPPTPFSVALSEEAQKKGCIIAGFVSGIPLRHLYRGASLFVLPSSHEGLPIVLLEAMSYGKRILASNIQANLDVNLDPDSYFKVFDIEDLRSKALQILQEPPASIFQKGMKTKYNWSIIAEETQKVYQGVIQR